MKVICINDTIHGYNAKLTIGKIYESKLIHDEDSWEVINDVGIEMWYSKNFLMPLDNFRNMKLKELGI
jgi:hypothetical protein